MTIRSESTPRPPSVPVGIVSGEFSDFDELAETVAGWGLDWIQLDRGKLQARIRQVAGRSILLSRFEFSRKFHQRGRTPPGLRTFGFPGRRSPAPEWRGRASRENEVVVFPANDEFDSVSHAGFFGDTVSISEERIRQVSRHLGLPDPLKALSGGLDLVATDPAMVDSIRKHFDFIHLAVGGPADDQRDAARWAVSESELLATLIKSLWEGSERKPRHAGPVLRRRALREALEFIDAYADDAPTVEMICAAADASWRTLNYAFRERFDLTPKQYLQRVRLQRFRKDLARSSSELSISEIAAHRGFWHMGKLAADYQREFGELPSETRGTGPRRASLSEAPPIRR